MLCWFESCPQQLKDRGVYTWNRNGTYVIDILPSTMLKNVKWGRPLNINKLISFMKRYCLITETTEGYVLTRRF